MRRSGITTPDFQNVCIFCASKWPPRTPARKQPQLATQQRRFFKSGHIARWRSATATAAATPQVEDKNLASFQQQHQQQPQPSPPPPQQTSRFPQKPGGWAKRDFVSEFSVGKAPPPSDPLRRDSSSRPVVNSSETSHRDTKVLWRKHFAAESRDQGLNPQVAHARAAHFARNELPTSRAAPPDAYRSRFSGNANRYEDSRAPDAGTSRFSRNGGRDWDWGSRAPDAGPSRFGRNEGRDWGSRAPDAGPPRFARNEGRDWGSRAPGAGTSRFAGNDVQDLSRATDAGTSRFSRNEVQDLSHAADAGTTKFNRMPSTSWKHMTFNPAANGGLKATIDSPVSSVSPISANATVDPYGLNVKSEQEKSREERLAQTRDGRFVGFKTPAETDALAPPTPVPNYKPFVFVDDENPPMPRKTVRESPTVESRWDSSDRYELRTGSSPYGKNRERHRKRSNFVSEHEEDEDDRMEERMQRKKERSARKKAGPPTPIILPEYISIANLATALKVRVEDFGAKMHELGFEETNHDYILDAETAGLIASEFNYQPVTAPNESIDLHARPPAQDKALLPSRPPVVTIMGHVDHGKTTLLDWLRKSSVAASEHGGITQHIGAFSVSMPSGRLITFLDTPGHAAFLSMRQRGANVTDIVILVVAADDSVKPQTLEALKHSQAAKVPIIVAVNKVDKEDANVDRVKQDLARYGVEIEDFGGDTQVVAVSGKTGQGMEELEDAVVALADVLDMRAETDGAAEGWVLEATTKKAGRVATVLVSRGTIRPGDVIVAGTTWARVRTLRNEGGAPVLAAGPGTPVEIDGWREQPSAGDEVLQASNEQQAKSVVAYRTVAAERDRMATDVAALNEARRLAQQKREQEEQKEVEKESVQEAAPTATSEPGIKEVFFIIKADVSGSVEAVVNSISALGNSEVRPHILRSGVGPVTEFDIEHAMTAKGHILSFNTVIDPSMNRMAEAAGVQIIDQSIIYRLVDDVKAKLSEYLTPIITQKVLGEAEISQIFDINIKRRVKIPIAGCKVRNGVITRKGKVRVLRGQEVIYEGTLSSLKNVKKDVQEMRKGSECGIGFENWTDFQIGDFIQSYEEKSQKRSL